MQVDRQQVVDRFRVLVEITGDGGAAGDELRHLTDLELESKRLFTGMAGSGSNRAVGHEDYPADRDKIRM